MSCGERVAGDTRGLVGAMTLALKNTQIEPVPIAGTSAVTSLSAQQDRPSTREAEAVRSRPAPPELAVKLKPSSLLLTSASAIDTPEVCSCSGFSAAASIL